jgi:type II secretory pathway component PulK
MGCILRNNGSILIITLLALGILSIFTVQMGYGVRQKLTLSDRLNTKEKLYYLAKAGVNVAIADIKKANEEYKDNPASIYAHTGRDPASIQGRDFIIDRYLDEEEKINTNKAKLKVIQRLIMIITGLSDIGTQGIAASIVNWGDKNSQLSIPLGSIENSYYRNLKNSYETKDDKFEVIEELLLVRCINREFLNDIYGGSGQINNWRWHLGEKGKININKAKLKVIQRLIMIITDLSDTEAQNIAASIIDWRDKDSQLSIPLGSAEDSYYRNSKNPYEAKDDKFEVIEELLLVKDINRKIFDKLKNYVTIYGNGKININTASKEVLLALGLNKTTVDKILMFRCGEDSIEFTSDDNSFEKISSIALKLSQSVRLSPKEIAQINNLVARGTFTPNPNYYTIRSIGKLNNKKGTYQISALAKNDGTIVYWREEEKTKN